MINTRLFDRGKLGLAQAGGSLKKNRDRLFWTWIAYQTVKGTLTTAIIWVPAAAYWFG
ncbi:MAG: hypothetical protein AAF943_02650 [Pseudomonadota bacterium]